MRLRKEVINYLKSLPSDGLQDDQREVLHHLQYHKLAVFPYAFTSEYRPSDIKIFNDPGLGLLYMMWEGKRLYYRNGSQKKTARRYFNSLRLEQDTRSPHRYLTNTFDVNDGDVVVDLGGAEGIFSLSVVDRARHIYLFEPDPSWQRALKATFAPWSHKVTIIQKFVSDTNSMDTITLDTYFNEDQTVNFIKIDVEGAEASILKGASRLIAHQENLKTAICTYHRQEDAIVLDSLLKNLGFQNHFSKGFMLYHYDDALTVPYLRKAVLRSAKCRVSP